MKSILSLFVALTLSSLSMFAQNNGTTCSREVDLEFERLSGEKPTVHRSPMHVYISAYYDAATNTIEISYDGEAEGEVYLYLNDMMVGYSAGINTELSLPSYSGNYTIEIVSDTWTAYGYLQL